MNDLTRLLAHTQLEDEIICRMHLVIILVKTLFLHTNNNMRYVNIFIVITFLMCVIEV